MVYLERQWTRARAAGEGYSVNAQNEYMESMGAGANDAIMPLLSVFASVSVVSAIMGLKHKEAYKDIFMVTVAIPVLATLVAIGMASLI